MTGVTSRATAPDVDLSWHDEALCGQIGGDDWYPEKGQNADAVKAVCRGCPVRLACANHAIVNGEPFGVWGGLSERDRRLFNGRPVTIEVLAAWDARKGGPDRTLPDDTLVAVPDTLCALDDADADTPVAA